MAVKEHTLGETRYLTYQLIFPDGETWTNQTAFWGPLSTWLKLTQFAKRPVICIGLLRKGEYRWRDQNRVTHLVRIESVERPRVWGSQRKQKKGIILT